MLHTIASAQAWGREQLSGDQARRESELLLGHALQRERAWLFAHACEAGMTLPVEAAGIAARLAESLPIPLSAREVERHLPEVNARLGASLATAPEDALSAAWTYPEIAGEFEEVRSLRERADSLRDLGRIVYSTADEGA